MNASAVDVHGGSVDGPHGPIPVRRYVPGADVASAALPPIVWVHGGAFMWGGLDQPESDAVARDLAATGFPVVTLAYRLARFPPFSPAVSRRPRGGAPRVTYPVPVDDVAAVIHAVASESPDGIIVGGASAGACLAAGALTRMVGTDTGRAVRGAFFAYGLFHANSPTPSPELRARITGRRRYTHTPRSLHLVNLNYAGTRAAMRKPDAFPGGHPVTGFPPTLLVDADHDLMRASARQFARELAAADVPVHYRVMVDAHHAFLNRPHDPAYSEAVDLIGRWATRVGRAAQREGPAAQSQ